MLGRLRVQVGSSPALRYAITAAGALLLLGATSRLVTPFHGVLFSLPIAAVALVTYSVGTGPALLLSLVVGLGLWWSVLEPRGSFAVTRVDDVDHVIAYFLTCATVVWTMQRMRRTQGSLIAAKAQVDRALQIERRGGETVRASEERYRRLFESMEEGFALHELVYDDAGRAVDYRFLEVNPAFGRLTGLEPCRIVGRTVREVIPDIEPAWVETYARVVRSGEAERFQAEAAALGRWFECFAFPAGAGRFGVAFTDVSERRRAEETLGRQAREYRTLAENSPEAIARFDRRLRHLYINEYGARVYGRPCEEVLGKTTAELGLPGEQAAAWTRHLELVFATGAQHAMEFELDGPSFGHQHLSSLLVPEKDDLGRVASVLAITRDVTTLRKAEQAVRERNQRLEESDRLKNEFLGLLSHELRNPLAPIRNSVYILENAPPGSEQMARARRVIDRQVRQMTRLIDDLLDVTRISRGKVSLHRQSFELNELVRRTVEDHLSVFAQSGVTLELVLAPEPLSIEGDPARVSQIVGNLLQNAAKFTPGGGHATVAVARDGAEGAVIRVRDDGPGLAPEMLAHVFEPFVQAETTLERTRGGLGLGLALVKGLAELHGGDVSARSEGIGRGAEFVVRLPLVRAAFAAPLHPPRRRERRGGHRVLVVDDNADTASSLKEALELRSNLVETAASAGEGLEKARQFRPEVVLCDIGLPDMDGYELARRMRADPELRAIHLVAVSGYLRPIDLQRARDAGFEDHLAKPTPLEQLEERIDRLVPSPPGGPQPAP